MWNEDYGNDSGSEAEENEGIEQKFVPSYVVLAIDCHSSMFERNQGDDALPFRTCMQACFDLADNLILATQWSPFAIVLAKQEIEFVNFTDSIIDTRQKLASKLALSDEALKAEFSRDYKLEYSNFFLRCKKVFHDVTASFFKRTLIFITNDPDPVLGNKMEKYQCITEVKTFSASEIRFEVVTTRKDFNYELFYNELFAAMLLFEDVCTDAERLLDKFSMVVDPKLRKQKIHFYPFRGDTERFISMISFTPIRGSHRLLLNKKLTKDGKKIKLSSVDDNIESEYIFKFKRKTPSLSPNLTFSSTERDSQFESTLRLGLHLIYVSSRNTKPGLGGGTTRLIQEDSYKPSDYFSKFWQCCAQSDRVLVCLFKCKQIDMYRYVELIPLMVNNKPTFMMQVIPFGSALQPKENSGYPTQESRHEDKELIEELVEDLTLDYDPSMFPDTFQRRRLSYIRAKLLGSVDMEEEEFVTFNKDGLDKALGDLPDRFSKAFYLDKKRKGESSGNQNKKGRKLNLF